MNGNRTQEETWPAPVRVVLSDCGRCGGGGGVCGQCDGTGRVWHWVQLPDNLDPVLVQLDDGTRRVAAPYADDDGIFWQEPDDYEPIEATERRVVAWWPLPPKTAGGES